MVVLHLLVGGWDKRVERSYLGIRFYCIDIVEIVNRIIKNIRIRDPTIHSSYLKHVAERLNIRIVTLLAYTCARRVFH